MSENKEDLMIWKKSYPDGISWDENPTSYPVFEMLDQTVKTFKDRPAFDFLGYKMNWGEVGFLVDRMAEGLQNLGVVKGKKVGIFLPNCPFFMISYYAILKAGGTVVNFNPLYAQRELQYQVEDSHTDIMITLDLKALYDKASALLHETRVNALILCRFTDILPFPKNILFKTLKRKEIAKVNKDSRLVWFHNLIKNDGTPAKIDFDPEEDVAVLQYTGGTTGVPKGAMLTHQNVSANTEQAVMWFIKAKPGEEKMLGVLPFFHVFAMTAIMNLSVRLGFEIIALPRFDLEQTLKVISEKKPHYFPAVPAIYNAVNNHKNIDKYDLNSLRYCISGGAPLPAEVKKSFEELSGCVVVEGYGLSETSPVLTVNPLEGLNKAGSIGLPLPATTLVLIDPESKKEVAPGERGEVCAKGPQVMKGYWNKPKETNEVIRNGLLHTGDIGIVDEDGYFFIVDRIKDLIITNGYNVYPRNVEEAIYLHSNVEECVVAGVKDKSRGEVVKAWIKPKEGRELTSEDLKGFLSDKLSKIEMPRQIEIRDKPLPKTMVGKLSKKDLLEEEAKKKA
jgi:long-chain acyl-CoA synthetase